MKHSSAYFLMIVFSAVCFQFCTQNKPEIPDILKNHKSKALFTKLTDGTAKTMALFNGKDLSGWYSFLEKGGKNKDVKNAFKIDDGILHFGGDEMGYIGTNDSYKNYYLRVVFRWGEKKWPPRLDSPRDSGILYHVPVGAEDRIWPTCVECQVQENDCGDYWLVNGATAKSPNASEGAQDHITKTANYENPNPEWNTIEIVCFDDKSEHYINGHLVNEAYNLSISEGKILLQLEGAEIFYKSLELFPLK
jgi:hypothetical protein